jgi:hypothetical protein
MQSSTIYLPVAFNNLAPMKETLVSRRVSLHSNFLEPVGTLHMVSHLLDVRRRFGWYLISSKQINLFFLQQQKSTLSQIGTNHTLAAKKNTIVGYHV